MHKSCKVSYKKRFWIRGLLILLITVLGVGCQKQRVTGGANPAPIATVTQRTIVPQRSNNLEPTLVFPNKAPTLVHTTQALGPMVTPPIKTLPSNSTPISLITLTPFPTIPPSEIPNYVRNLMLHDDDCQFPCWWGIEPNKTSWEEAHQFLGSFSEQFGDGFVLNIPATNSTNTIIKYSILFKISEEEKGDATFSVRDGLVINVEIGPTGMEAFYPLSRLLSKLGSPDAIDVATFRDYGSHGQLEFTILLKYDQIRASYTFKGEKIGNTIQACLRPQLVGPRLKLGEQLDNNDQASSQGILPIDTATGINVQTFMLQFRDPEDNMCLETPAELWP